jgi:hypothetical protein
MKGAVFLLVIWLSSPVYAGSSAIDFVSETHDFGHVTQGELLEHVFEFSNTGTEELVIDKIETS